MQSNLDSLKISGGCSSCCRRSHEAIAIQQCSRSVPKSPPKTRTIQPVNQTCHSVESDSETTRETISNGLLPSYQKRRLTRKNVRLLIGKPSSASGTSQGIMIPALVERVRRRTEALSQAKSHISPVKVPREVAESAACRKSINALGSKKMRSREIQEDGEDWAPGIELAVTMARLHGTTFCVRGRRLLQTSMRKFMRTHQSPHVIDES